MFTACALYAIAFEYLNIPYIIKEIPGHIYLIVYPNEERIVLETTSYNFGLLALNKTQMAKRKKLLLKNGLISKESVNAKNLEDIYEDEYSKDLEISLTNLIGVLYFNNSILKSDSLLYDKAIVELEKGLQLCSIIDMQDMKIWLIYMLLEEVGAYLHLEQFCIMAVKYYNANSHLKFNIEYLDYFLNYLYEIVKNNKSADISSEFIPCFSEKINNPHLVESIEYTSQMELAEKYFDYGMYKTALTFLRGKYRSDDEKYQSMLKECVMAYVRNHAVNESIFDFVNEVRVYFPLLVEKEWFESIDSYCYMLLTNLYFRNNKPNTGERYLKRCLEELGDDVFSETDLMIVDYAYSAASAYYVRLEDYLKGEMYLRKGLLINPNSETLNRKLNVLLDFQSK